MPVETMKHTTVNEEARNNFGKAGLRCWIARTFVTLVLRLFFRVRVHGREHLPARGPYIVVATHRGWADPFLIVAVLPLEPRPHFLADKASVEQTPFRRWVLRLFGGVVPIVRGRRIGDDGALGAAARVLEGGGVLGIFPEGTVAAPEGEMLPVQRGVAHLALRAQVPIVPVAISGVKELYWGKAITVEIGPAFVPQPGDGPVAARMTAVTEQVETALRALLRPYQEPPVRRKWLRDWLTHLFD